MSIFDNPWEGGTSHRTSVVPDCLELCGPCQQDDGRHGSCAELGGVMFMFGQPGVRPHPTTCMCHLAGHPTARDR